MSILPHSVDRMPPEMRKPRAGPILDPDEVICNGLIFALQFEFWKHPKRLTANCQAVAAITEALRLAGYSIVPTEAKRGEQ